MLPVTAGPSPLIAFDDLLDLERSRAFHEGRQALGLSSMESLLKALRAAGHLQRPPGLCVHVAGSEGKTSVTELIAAGLRAAAAAFVDGGPGDQADIVGNVDHRFARCDQVLVGA